MLNLKHFDEIKKIISVLHEEWMDQDDEDAFDIDVMARMGKEMDDAIEKGIARGYSAEHQAILAKRMLEMLVEKDMI